MDQQKWLEQMRAELEKNRKELSDREGSLTDLRTNILRLENAIGAMEGNPVARGGRDGRTRRTISPEARERIVAAQRKRWEKVRELKTQENREKEKRLRAIDAESKNSEHKKAQAKK